MALSESARRRIEELLGSDRVVLFMKGTRQQPQCGFSAAVVELLDELLPDYTTVDVLSDPELREAIKEYGSWPTIPQLYVEGELVGGCDIVRELYGSGELHRRLGVPVPERRAPTIRIDERAADMLRRAAEERGGYPLHLRVDRHFAPQLYVGPPEPGEVEVEAGGVRLRLDWPSARRADGISIEWVERPGGGGLQVSNPNARSAGSSATEP